MDFYRDHEREFTKSLSAANKKVSQYVSEDGPDYLIAEAKKFADEAERQLNIMENDLRSMASNESAQLQKKFFKLQRKFGPTKVFLTFCTRKKRQRRIDRKWNKQYKRKKC
jgi:hypothetical protein